MCIYNVYIYNVYIYIMCMYIMCIYNIYNVCIYNVFRYNVYIYIHNVYIYIQTMNLYIMYIYISVIAACHCPSCKQHQHHGDPSSACVTASSRERRRGRSRIASEMTPRSRRHCKRLLFWEDWEIRPHRRCWGVIFRMALVKGYRFTWGGGHFSAKTSCF